MHRSKFANMNQCKPFKNQICQRHKSQVLVGQKFGNRAPCTRISVSSFTFFATMPIRRQRRKKSLDIRSGPASSASIKVLCIQGSTKILCTCLNWINVNRNGPRRILSAQCPTRHQKKFVRGRILSRPFTPKIFKASAFTSTMQSFFTIQAETYLQTIIPIFVRFGRMSLSSSWAFKVNLLVSAIFGWRARKSCGPRTDFFKNCYGQDFEIIRSCTPMQNSAINTLTQVFSKTMENRSLSTLHSFASASHEIFFTSVVTKSDFYDVCRVSLQEGHSKKKTMNVIVTLTTIPSRLNNLDTKKCFDSLIFQKIPLSVQKYEIHVNIPEMCKETGETYELPQWFNECQKHKHFRVFRTEDYGPNTKMIPTLLRCTDPDCIVIVCDDDFIYDFRMVRSHVEARSNLDHAALGFAGLKSYQPKHKNDRDFFLACVQENTPCQILQAYKTISYRRKFFDESYFQDFA